MHRAAVDVNHLFKKLPVPLPDAHRWSRPSSVPLRKAAERAEGFAHSSGMQCKQEGRWPRIEGKSAEGCEPAEMWA